MSEGGSTEYLLEASKEGEDIDEHVQHIRLCVLCRQVCVHEESQEVAAQPKL